jgi:hypothetical protein
MTSRIASLFRDALHPLGQGEERLPVAEVSSALVPLTYTLSEGDVSVDLMRRYCQGEGLDLRRQYQSDHWYDLVGEVNIGINLYYVIEAGRLWQVIERRERRVTVLTPLLSRMVAPIARSRPALAPASPNAPGPRGQPPSRQAPPSVESFLGEAQAPELLPRAVFARYVGRVFSTWLDCGPVEQAFPQTPAEPEAEGRSGGAVRLASAIAATADIRLTPPQIHEAWNGEVEWTTSEA